MSFCSKLQWYDSSPYHFLFYLENRKYTEICFRSWYHDDNTASRLLSEVKHRRARFVLRWGTTLESRVLFF